MFLAQTGELALFELLFKENISKTEREKLKQASKALLASLCKLLRPMPEWTKNTSTQAEVKVFILDTLKLDSGFRRNDGKGYFQILSKK